MHTIADSNGEKPSGLTRRHGSRSEVVNFSLPTHSQSQTSSSNRDSLVSRISSTKSYIRPYFRSRIVAKESIEKPWLDEPKSRWPVIIPYFGIFVGLALAGLQMYLGWASVIQNKYCLVMEDGFDGAILNSSLWNYEVQAGGFG